MQAALEAKRQTERATSQQKLAEKNKNSVIARQLEIQAETTYSFGNRNIEKSILLATESLRRDAKKINKLPVFLQSKIPLLRKNIATLAHAGLVMTLAFSPDGKFLATNSGNKVQFWFWQAKDLIEYACSRLNRNLTYTE